MCGKPLIHYFLLTFWGVFSLFTHKSQIMKSRNWCYTLNNYNVAMEHRVQATECKYNMYGREKGDSGTPHLQGTVVFANAVRMAGAVEKLGGSGIHVEPTKDLFASFDYCSKDGNTWEAGTRPLNPKQKGAKGKLEAAAAWDRVLKLAKVGRIDEIDSRLQVTQCRNLEYVHNREQHRKRHDDTTYTMLWLHGKTGTGKSREARRVFPGAFLKMCNKWWDGYANQRAVIIDDFDKNHAVLCHHLKIWADRYPFPAEIKGSSAVIRPWVFVVTSNWSIDEIWQDEQDALPLKRRFTQIEYADTLPMLDGYALPEPVEEIPSPPPTEADKWEGSECEELFGMIDSDAERAMFSDEDEEEGIML